MRTTGENDPSMSGYLRRRALLLFVLGLFSCPGCYEHVVGGNSPYVEKSDVYRPNVDENKGALEEFADDLVGGGEKKK